MGGVANAVGGVIGLGAKGADLPMTIMGGGAKPAPPQTMVNSVDPRLQQMRDQQIQAAKDFQTNLPGYESTQQSAAADTSRQALAKTLANTTAGSNSRGMLYGSYNQGQKAQAAAQNEADLQQTKAGINTNAQNTLSQLQNQALGTGLMVNQTQQNENDQAYQIALARQQAASQAFGNLLGGAGGLLGRALG